MQQSEGKSALLAGASGLVGSELLQLLLNSREYCRITAIVRRPLGITHNKLHQVVVDFDRLDSYRQEFAVEDVFCCLGTTIKQARSQEAFKHVDVDYPLEIARLALGSQAKKFLIVSSMGANAKSLVFYSRMKGVMEEELKQLGFPALHIFRPSLLMGERREPRFGENVAAHIAKAIPILFSGPLKKYRPIEAKQVATAMYAAAQSTNNGTFTYSSDQIWSMG